MDFFTLLLIAVIAGVVLGSVFGYLMHGAPKKKGQEEKGGGEKTAESEPKEKETAEETNRDIETVEMNSEENATEESSADSIGEYNEEREEDVEKGKEKILEQLRKEDEITNDKVVELLDVSDSTAYRYLEELETEGRIKQIGETGRSVKYTIAE